MDPARGVLETSMRWMDDLWDDAAALLWNVRRDRHMTRETALYALGLLRRDGRDGVRRAERALRAVLAQQFPMEGTPFDGTFRRAPEEPDPPDDALMWIHYDPNWRQFIGTNFATILDAHGDALSGALVDDLRASVDRCVAGEPDDRVAPTYANIALMKAWLDSWTGRTNTGESLARATYEHFDRHGAFLEYNSPTYYGIDLSALAMWRSSSSGVLRELGRDMEQRLWRDVARYYHAGLRNLCGPYDRAYGMEMTAHATPLGLYVWTIVGREEAPFPPTSGKFSHPHDLCFGPLIEALPTAVPDDVVPRLAGFNGERKVEQIISDEPKRVVTAWLGRDAMIGAWSGPPSGIGWFQHHHATIHTRSGWLRLSPQTAADARAERGVLTIDASDQIKVETAGSPDIAFDTTAPRSDEGNVTRFGDPGEALRVVVRV